MALAVEQNTVLDPVLVTLFRAVRVILLLHGFTDFVQQSPGKVFYLTISLN